jgi:hypothetical protein
LPPMELLLFSASVPPVGVRFPVAPHRRRRKFGPPRRLWPRSRPWFS